MYFYLSVKTLLMEDIENTNVSYIVDIIISIVLSRHIPASATGMIECKYAKSG